MVKLRIDFHTHTYHSADSLTRIEALLETARKRGLDKVAVTDHNTIEGALAAYQADPQMVIIGEEIKTTKGELLGYFLEEEIKPFQDPFETIAQLREQNAFISISHPFDRFRSGWTREDLIEMAPLVDGIETYNARCFTRAMNKEAASFAKAFNLPGTAGSDAHAAREIGNGQMLLPDFSNADELRVAAKDGRAGGRLAGFWVRLYSMYAKLYKNVPGLWKEPG